MMMSLHRCNSVWFWTLWRANSFKPPTTEHATTSVIHDEGTTDAAQRVPPSPGMDRDLSKTIESSIVLLSQEPVDKDTLRVTYAAPRDSVEQGVHLSPEEDTAKPVVSVAIFPKDTNFITKICAGHLEVDRSNATNLVLNADTIISG